MIRLFAATSILALVACNGADDVTAQENTVPAPAPDAAQEAGTGEMPFTSEALGQFDEPWAMTFLPDGRLLVTEQAGEMKTVTLSDGAEPQVADVSGIPEVDYGGQGGLGDVVAHPDFADNRMLYISFAEAGQNDTRGAAVARGTLNCADAGPCALEGAEVIWRQSEKVEGRGHFGHRIAFGPDGMLYISSGERQKFDPAQDMSNDLGSIVRLNADGSVPSDNPFADRGGATANIWSYGHRNPLGIAFAPDGTLWEHEMGPKGGDELNIIVKGDNYGYPEVSNGIHYDGRNIPDHSAGDGFNAPEVSWTPVISPAGFVIYTGDKFPAWQGTGLIGGLSSQAIIQVSLDGENAREVGRYDMGERIREIEQGPDGYVYVLEDMDDGSGGRLLRLTPRG
jgi:glucose/arabinose dehydrogenase|tara:strand:- start:24854 stop:26041 length:1188 start_codon:yes stop_codon:yes gene_type:complete